MRQHGRASIRPVLPRDRNDHPKICPPAKIITISADPMANGGRIPLPPAVTVHPTVRTKKNVPMSSVMYLFIAFSLGVSPSRMRRPIYFICRKPRRMGRPRSCDYKFGPTPTPRRHRNRRLALALNCLAGGSPFVSVAKGEPPAGRPAPPEASIVMLSLFFDFAN